MFSSQKFHIGRVGDASHNGGWFAHLHLQLMTDECMEPYVDKMEWIDGYSQDGVVPEGVLDPMDLIRDRALAVTPGFPIDTASLITIDQIKPT
jgi:hypothetical protein